MKRSIIIAALLLISILAARNGVQAQEQSAFAFTGFRSQNGGVQGLFGLGVRIGGEGSPLYALSRFDVAKNGQMFEELAMAIKPIKGTFLSRLTFWPLAGGGVIVEGETDPLWFISSSVGLAITYTPKEHWHIWTAVRNAVPIDEGVTEVAPATFGAGLAFSIQGL